MSLVTGQVEVNWHRMIPSQPKYRKPSEQQIEDEVHKMSLLPPWSNLAAVKTATLDWLHAQQHYDQAREDYIAAIQNVHAEETWAKNELYSWARVHDDALSDMVSRWADDVKQQTMESVLEEAYLGDVKKLINEMKKKLSPSQRLLVETFIQLRENGDLSQLADDAALAASGMKHVMDYYDAVLRSKAKLYQAEKRFNDAKQQVEEKQAEASAKQQAVTRLEERRAASRPSGGGGSSKPKQDNRPWWQKAGGKLSDGWKDFGGDISDGWKDFGGDVSDGWKRFGGKTSDAWKSGLEALEDSGFSTGDYGGEQERQGRTVPGPIGEKFRFKPSLIDRFKIR